MVYCVDQNCLCAEESVETGTRDIDRHSAFLLWSLVTLTNMPTLKEVKVPIADVGEPAVNLLQWTSMPTIRCNHQSQVKQHRLYKNSRFPPLVPQVKLPFPNLMEWIPRPRILCNHPSQEVRHQLYKKVVIPISPAMKGQKMRYNVIKVAVSKVTKMESFKPTTSKFPLINAPIPTVLPETPPYKTNTHREFVTLPNLSPKEQSLCAKFCASLKKKEPITEGWWLLGKIHLKTLTQLNQTTWFNDELMDYCFKNIDSLFGGDCSP